MALCVHSVMMVFVGIPEGSWSILHFECYYGGVGLKALKILQMTLRTGTGERNKKKKENGSECATIQVE